MDEFKKWVEIELKQSVDALHNIPSTARKGLITGMHRQRAREAKIALQLIAEFELVRCRVDC